MMRAVNTNASRTPGSLRSSAHLSLQCATTRPLSSAVRQEWLLLVDLGGDFDRSARSWLHHRDLREPQVRVDDCERRLALRNIGAGRAHAQDSSWGFKSQKVYAC